MSLNGSSPRPHMYLCEYARLDLNDRGIRHPLRLRPNDNTPSQLCRAAGFRSSDVRFGSGADITRYIAIVRLNPQRTKRSHVGMSALCQ